MSKNVETYNYEKTLAQIKQLMEPKSIALVGASDATSKVGGVITRNLLSSEYAGKIYLVNPRKSKIFNFNVYPSLREIPGEIDLVEIVIPAEHVPEVVKEAAEKKVKGIIIISSGFAEVGNVNLQNEVVKIAKENNIRVIGPNCFGVVNTEISLDLTFTFTKAMLGNIAFVSQSGAMCCGALDWASKYEIGFSKFINLGNKCDVDEGDLLPYLAEDTQTKVVAMYIEGIKEGRKFLKFAKEVIKKKPILTIKSGVSEAGMRAARSHTGSLAGSDRIVDGAFKQTGIIRVEEIETLFNTAIAFVTQQVPVGKNVAIISNAGGLGVLTADWCSKLGLNVPAFNTSTKNMIRKHIPSIGSPINPVDMTGGADYEVYYNTLEIAINDPSINIIIPIYVSQGLITSDIPARAVADCVAENNPENKTILAIWMGGESTLEGVSILRHKGIPVYDFPEKAAKVAANMFKYNVYKKKLS
ncbi:MAG: acetate--CoA ligase family protein [Candidatus Odinarchaeia archaeon]